MARAADDSAEVSRTLVPRFLSTGNFLGGAAALGIALIGTGLVQVLFALKGVAPLADCVEQVGADALGVDATCRIVRAFGSNAETALLVSALILGVLTMVVGFSTYRLMDTRTARRRAFAGGALGIQAALVAAFLLWFRGGELALFCFQFLNWAVLHGHMGAFVIGAKNTVILAVAGEAGGLLLGLTLSLFTLSDFRVVRAPARAYINFFRGTPLIWQLSAFYFGLSLGLRLPLSSYQTAILVFCLNIGAYSAEVFRAGIQSIEGSQMDAARGLGFSQLQAMRYSIVPQAFRRVIPPLLNEFVGLIKDTSLILVLGLTLSQRDIFSTASDGYSTTFNATFYVAAAVGYLAITLPLIRLVNAVETRLRSGLVGVGA